MTAETQGTTPASFNFPQFEHRTNAPASVSISNPLTTIAKHPPHTYSSSPLPMMTAEGCADVVPAAICNRLGLEPPSDMQTSPRHARSSSIPLVASCRARGNRKRGARPKEAHARCSSCEPLRNTPAVTAASATCPRHSAGCAAGIRDPRAFGQEHLDRADPFQLSGLSAQSGDDQSAPRTPATAKKRRAFTGSTTSAPGRR
jgi:hypothetical protein